MRDVIDCIKRYIKVTESEKFVIHWKTLAKRLLNGIEDEYQRNSSEQSIVESIERIINNVGQFSTRDKRLNFGINTNSIFIHGNKSQVEFEYYGKSTKRELGDIIFILSVVYQGRKFFEKMTINQVKKSKNVSWNFNSKSAKEQLYLLSRFPTFRRVRGLIPNKEYNLPNYSGCLGTHGLLYSPGDFALISSKELEVILAGKNNLKLNDLHLSTIPYNICSCFPCCCLLNDIDFEDWLYILHKLIHFYPRYFRYLPFICNLPILGNSCKTYNVYDFSDKYLRGCIGEPIYAEKLSYNRVALQFLHDLLYAIEKKAKREKLEDVLNFISSFYSYGYGGQGVEGYGEIDYDGGGIGIIHTIINLENRKGK